jgi:hypothetical protein
VINIAAIITLVAVALVAAITNNLMPAIDVQVRVLLITVVSSFAAEGLGFAPRVLWIVPLWLAALAFLGIHIYEQYGVLGVIGVVVAAAILLALTILLGKFHERRRERRTLAERLRTTDLRGLNPIYDQAWDTVHEAILQPRFTPWTKEICEHNRKVAELVVAWLLDKRPPAARAERLRAVVEVFASAAADPSQVEASKLAHESAWLMAMIRNRDSLDRAELDGQGGELLSERIRELRRRAMQQ